MEEPTNVGTFIATHPSDKYAKAVITKENLYAITVVIA